MTTTRARIIQYGVIILIAALGGGYWYWKQAKAAQTVNDNRPSFEAPLTHDLNLSAGQGIATYSRADGADRRATVTDFEGRIIPVKQNEARFEGARRVENLFSYSNDFSNAAWTVQLGATKIGTNQMSLTSTGGSGFYQQMGAAIPDNNGRTFRYSIDVQWVSGDTSYQMGGYSDVGFSVSPNATITVSSEWKRFSILATTHASTDATNLSFNLIRGANGGIINVRNAQLEEVTGQANQNPSEYVSTNVLPAFPYHGAGVDRVKYFDTENGNTVASNVVTEATGAALPATTIRGYLAEGARTNLLTYSEQFGSWTSDDGSISADVAVAPDGRSTADKFVSNTNAAQHRVKQSVSLTAGVTYTGTVYVKKAGYDYHMKIWSALGSATLSANLDAGTIINTGGGEYVGSSITALPNGWYRISLTMTTVSGGAYTQMNYLYNNSESFTGDGTSGVYLWGAQLEQARFASSYIPTTTATVARVKDSLAYPSAENTNTAQGSTTAEVYGSSKDFSTAFDRILSIDDGVSNANAVTLLFNGNVGSDQGRVYSGAVSGGVNQTAAGSTTGTKLTSPASLKVGTSWITGRHTFFDSGILRDTKTFTAPVSFTDIHVGTSSALSTQGFVNVKNVRIWKKALSDTELQNMTSTTEGIATSAVKETTLKNAPNTTGLVGYWSFEDGSGTEAEDFSPTGTNTGTLTNGPTWVDGKIGKALSFDGTNDYITAGDIDVIDNATALTYCTWVKHNSITSDDAIVEKSKSSSPNDGSLLFRDDVSGISGRTDIYSFVVNDSADADTTRIETPSGVGGQVGVWTHVCGMYLADNASGLNLYVDGVGVADNPVSTIGIGAISGGTYPLTIGIRYDETNMPFDGQIDEVRIYDYALSASEIAGLYAQGSTGKTTVNASQNNDLTSGLIGLWSFNGPDLSGTTAYDRSGQGNNGTLTNGPSVYPGKVGQGLRLDGTNDSVSIDDPVSGILDFGADDFSVSVWIKADGSTQDRIVNKFKATGSDGWLFDINETTGGTPMAGHVRFRMNDASDNNFDYAVDGAVDDGSWHNVSVSLDRDSVTGLKMFVDGLQIGTSQNPTAVSGSLDNDQPLAIGVIPSGTGSYFSGLIDEVRVYNRALSAAEILALYQMGR